MLFFIQKRDGSVIHNVAMIQKFSGGRFYYVTTADGFGKTDSKILEIPIWDVTLISTYEFINKGMRNDP